MGAALKRSVVAGGIVYPAGTAATEELRRRITNPDHWSEPPSAESVGYGSMTVEQLKGEIRTRNDDRDGDLLPLTGSKADLVAALDADDRS